MVEGNSKFLHKQITLTSVSWSVGFLFLDGDVLIERRMSALLLQCYQLRIELVVRIYT